MRIREEVSEERNEACPEKCVFSSQISSVMQKDCDLIY